MRQARALASLARCVSGSLLASPSSTAVPAALQTAFDQIPQQGYGTPSTSQRAGVHYVSRAHGVRMSAHLPHQLQHTRGMFIQTQPTPNPHSLMFQPGQKVMENGSHEFSDARAGMTSPLAKRLFTVDGVAAVFFGADFITVTKQEDISWSTLKPLVFSAVMDHYASGEPLFTDADTLARSDTAIHEDDDEIVAMIKELLETRIRPAVMEDGGDITYRGFDVDTGVVTVKMMGACSGCPSSTVTLKSGIENMLMHYIPEVKGVIEAVDEGEEAALEEFKKLDEAIEKKEAAAQQASGQQ